MEGITTRERRALASVIGHCALQLAADITDPRWGAELMGEVTLLMALLGLTYEDFSAIVAIGRELTAQGCGCAHCAGNV